MQYVDSVHFERVKSVLPDCQSGLGLGSRQKSKGIWGTPNFG